MFIVEVPKEILILENKSMWHIFRKVSVSDGEAGIRFFSFCGTPPTHQKVKFSGGGKQLFVIRIRSKRGTSAALGEHFL